MAEESANTSPKESLALTFDIATPLSEIVKSVIEFTYNHRARFGDEPAFGSRAAFEFADHLGEYSEQRCFDGERTHESAAGIYIPSAGFFLAALARLLCSEMELFGYQVVARSVIECSARAWWFVDAEATVEVRLARFYVDILDNLNQMARAHRLGADGLDQDSRDLVERAARSGLTPKFSKKKTDELVGFGDLSKIGFTDLAGRFFKALGYEHGEFWYRSFSAVVHGTPYGLLDFWEFEKSPTGEFQPLRPVLPIEAVLQAAVLSTQAYLGAIEFDCRHFGWDGESVATYRRQVLDRMVSLKSHT
jgi:hypothetical protein